MTISQHDLDQLLIHDGHGFTIVSQNPNGSRSTYTGRGVARFLENPVNRELPHRVTDSHRQLVYCRDQQGLLQFGNAEQLVMKMREKR